MSVFEAIWVDHATEQYNSLPVHVRQAVMGKVAQMEADLDPARFGDYDKGTDSYIAAFDYGLIMYAVVASVLRIILLRITAPGY